MFVHLYIYLTSEIAMLLDNCQLSFKKSNVLRESSPGFLDSSWISMKIQVWVWACRPEIMHNLLILSNVIYLMGFINFLMKNFISIFGKRRTRMQQWNLSCEVCSEDSGPWILVESLGGAQLWWSEHCCKASPLLWRSIL